MQFDSFYQNNKPLPVEEPTRNEPSLPIFSLRADIQLGKNGNIVIFVDTIYFSVGQQNKTEQNITATTTTKKTGK